MRPAHERRALALADGRPAPDVGGSEPIYINIPIIFFFFAVSDSAPADPQPRSVIGRSDGIRIAWAGRASLIGHRRPVVTSSSHATPVAVQPLEMSVGEPGEHSAGRLSACGQRAAGSLEHLVHQSATRKKNWKKRERLGVLDRRQQVQTTSTPARGTRVIGRHDALAVAVDAAPDAQHDLGMQEQRGDDGALGGIIRPPL